MYDVFVNLRLDADANHKLKMIGYTVGMKKADVLQLILEWASTKGAKELLELGVPFTPIDERGK